jgi:hypothetical protein
VSAAERFRLRCGSLLASGLASSEIGRRVGLVAASEVWGGEVPRDRPAWYLWLEGRDGAYQLELAGAEPLGGEGSRAAVGRFVVRHYPSRASPVLAGFSAEERRLALEVLDATGTPRMDVASGIPGALFVVGSVDWAVDTVTDETVVALASLDRLRTRDAAGEIVRDVPGWDLTAPVFALLAGLVAQVERRAAARLLVARQRGFELVTTADAADPRESAEVLHGEGFVSFPPAVARGVSSTLLQALRDPDAEVVLDVALRAHDREHVAPGEPVCGDGRLPLHVPCSWFGGEALRADRALCAC